MGEVLKLIIIWMIIYFDLFDLNGDFSIQM